MFLKVFVFATCLPMATAWACPEPTQLIQDRRDAMGDLRLHHRLEREELWGYYEQQIDDALEQLHANWAERRSRLEEAIGKARSHRQPKRAEALVARKQAGLKELNEDVSLIRNSLRSARLKEMTSLHERQQNERSARREMLQKRINRAKALCGIVGAIAGENEELAKSYMDGLYGAFGPGAMPDVDATIDRSEGSYFRRIFDFTSDHLIRVAPKKDTTVFGTGIRG